MADTIPRLFSAVSGPTAIIPARKLILLALPTYGRDKRFWESRGLGLPYVKWSRRPSLGLTWLQRFWPDLCSGSSMKFVLNGREVNVGCRYFLEKLYFLAPDVFDRISLERQYYLRLLDDEFSFHSHDDLSRRVAVQQHQQKRKVTEL